MEANGGCYGFTRSKTRSREGHRQCQRRLERKASVGAVIAVAQGTIEMKENTKMTLTTRQNSRNLLDSLADILAKFSRTKLPSTVPEDAIFPSLCGACGE